MIIFPLALLKLQLLLISIPKLQIYGMEGTVHKFERYMLLSCYYLEQSIGKHGGQLVLIHIERRMADKVFC